jgi:hypothetical protein
MCFFFKNQKNDAFLFSLVGEEKVLDKKKVETLQKTQNTTKIS